MKIPIPTQISQHPIRSTLFLAVLFFVIAGLIGIAHEDLRYKRTFLSATRVTEPEPGDIFLFDTASMSFEPDKICSRASAFVEVKKRNIVFVVYPSWASGIDNAIVLIRDVFPWLLGNGAEESKMASVSAIGPEFTKKLGFTEKLGSSFRYIKAYNGGSRRVAYPETCITELDKERSEKPSLIPVQVREVYYPADNGASDPNSVMFAMYPMFKCPRSVSPKDCPKNFEEKLMLKDIGFLPRVRAGLLSVHP